MSHPARGAWIEMLLSGCIMIGRESHPARGAWIEIGSFTNRAKLVVVAPRKGCVD